MPAASAPESVPADIVLATLNARYIHASFGLRCLRANLGTLRDRSVLVEGILQERPTDFVERILRHEPKVVGLGVYIWNVAPMTEVVHILKQVAPDVTVVVGGPEVSYEMDSQPICDAADVVVRREGETAFRQLCERLLGKPSLSLVSTTSTSEDGVIEGELEDLDRLVLPYDEYTDEDLAHRVVYLEASRGCPFRCAFCLSALDKKVRPFALTTFLDAMQRLFDRGLRQFKFVDRTFNLDLDVATAIVEFFLPHKDDVFLHFEMIPDRLPTALLELLGQFPDGAIQLEVGFQTFTPEVAAHISRRTKYDVAADNIQKLRATTGVHIHADLIAGLPGETWSSFARGFDTLYDVGPHEIQLGILKRLKGFPLAAIEDEFQLAFHPGAPFEVLQTSTMSFAELQRMRRTARFWDLVVNNGRFPLLVDVLAQHFKTTGSIFEGFAAMADALAHEAKGTHGIAHMRLASLLFTYAADTLGLDVDDVATALCDDFCADGKRRVPPVVLQHPQLPTGFADRYRVNFDGNAKADAKPARQARHASS